MLFIVMGVSGSGKTTLAKKLQSHFGGLFVEGDDFHTPENKAKMSAGIGLTDDDRKPWLQKLAQIDGDLIFMSCSCLKVQYRKFFPRAHFIFLDVPKDTLIQRLNNRKSHFVSVNLLESQLNDLEKPDPRVENLIHFREYSELVLQLEAIIPK